MPHLYYKEYELGIYITCLFGNKYGSRILVLGDCQTVQAHVTSSLQDINSAWLH